MIFRIKKVFIWNINELGPAESLYYVKNINYVEEYGYFRITNSSIYKIIPGAKISEDMVTSVTANDMEPAFYISDEDFSM